MLRRQLIASSSALARSTARATRSRPLSVRFYADEAPSKKPSVASIAELRKLLPGTSLIKARSALSSTTSGNDIEAAVKWLEEDRKKSGEKKAKKVEAREAGEGLVGVVVVNAVGPQGEARAAIVELNCETDFVARNETFVQLVKDVAHTASLFPSLSTPPAEAAGGQSAPAMMDLPVSALLEFPLFPASPSATPESSAPSLPRTVASAIRDAIGALGEKISLRRAAAIFPEPVPASDAPRRNYEEKTLFIPSAFAHGGPPTPTSSSSGKLPDNVLLSAGRVSSLLLNRFRSPSLPTLSSSPDFQKSVAALGRSLARQAAGMETASIHPEDTSKGEELDASSPALYLQPFIMLLPTAQPSSSYDPSSKSVRSVLEEWAIAKGLKEGRGAEDSEGEVSVVGMRRWKVGEGMERREKESFEEEVRRQAGLA